MKKSSRYVRFEKELKDLIVEIINLEYQIMGFEVEPDVKVVFQKEITISLNTEEPFLGIEFWDLLAMLGEQLESVLKITGYKYAGTKYVSDLCIIKYKFFEQD